MDFPIQKFGGTRNFLLQALAAWETRGEVEEAKREAEARIDAQVRREREERDKRRRLAELRTSVPEDVLETLRRRTEEALATDGAERGHLGYDVLVKLKLDELLEREFMPTDVSEDGGHGERAVP